VPSTNENFLTTDHLKSDLKGRSVRGGIVTIIAEGLKFLICMGSTVVLARLLTPKDFGLIAMVTAVTGFVMMFKDMGLSMATVQRAEITHAQVSTLFWINVGVSILLMLVTAALGPAISWFYGDPRLTWITIALAGGFIFGGLTIQHQALLRRQMRFTALAAVEIAGMSAGVLAAIISAFYGIGYWALVVMQVVMEAVMALGVWIACGWRPGLPVRGSGVREMLKFGGNLTGFNVVNYFARNADNLLIGKFWGAKALGLYSKAYGLLMLPLSQINAPLSAVAIPALSRLQDDPDQYRNYYLKTIGMIALVTMPGVTFLIVMSKEIILLVLGPQWTNAAPIFTFLGLAALFQPVSNTTGWLFVSQDRTNDMFRWSFIGGGLAVASIVTGLHWGAIGVAASYSITDITIRTPLLYWFVGRKGPVMTKDIYNALILPVCTSLPIFLVLASFRSYARLESQLVSLICAMGLTLVTACLVISATSRGRVMFRDAIDSSRLIFVRNKAS